MLVCAVVVVIIFFFFLYFYKRVCECVCVCVYINTRRNDDGSLCTIYGTFPASLIVQSGRCSPREGKLVSHCSREADLTGE